MYITITNNNTIKSTPSRGFSGEIPGERETEAREKDAEPDKKTRKLTPQIHCILP